MTHICVGNLTIIGSDNGLSPGRRQAIIWTNAGILLIGPLGTNFSEILIGIQTFSFKKMHLKMASAKWRPSCLVLNVLSQGNPFVFPAWWCHSIRLQELIFKLSISLGQTSGLLDCPDSPSAQGIVRSVWSFSMMPFCPQSRYGIVVNYRNLWEQHA